ncbi:MAG: MaoC family dehydratase [Geminicoccaceae bacterium]
MSAIGDALELRPGFEIRSAPRAMTRERMRWYVDAQPTVAADDGRVHTQPPTIHDDDDYARKQGLPGIIADGMISTNWIMGLLLDAFGRGVLRQGRLRTKYIAPIYENEVVIAVARVSAITHTAEGETAMHLDVWCQSGSGRKVTVGEALVYAGGR